MLPSAERNVTSSSSLGAGFPDSSWTEQFGDYCNGEPGCPLFVSLLLYLNDVWPRDWGAETLFLVGRACQNALAVEWQPAFQGMWPYCQTIDAEYNGRKLKQFGITGFDNRRTRRLTPASWCDPSAIVQC